jgi:hypothetical protein
MSTNRRLNGVSVEVRFCRQPIYGFDVICQLDLVLVNTGRLSGTIAVRKRPSVNLGAATATPIQDAITMFSDHLRTHSPDKPKTLQRYQEVLGHFERHLGKKKFVEVVTRAGIDDYKITRSGEFSQQHPRRITPRTVNFE